MFFCTRINSVHNFDSLHNGEINRFERNGRADVVEKKKTRFSFRQTHKTSLLHQLSFSSAMRVRALHVWIQMLSRCNGTTSQKQTIVGMIQLQNKKAVSSLAGIMGKPIVWQDTFNHSDTLERYQQELLLSQRDIPACQVQRIHKILIWPNAMRQARYILLKRNWQWLIVILE